MGLSYKPFSHVTEESQGLYITDTLSKAGARVVGFDPLAGEMAHSELHGKIVVLDSIEECLKQAEAVLITTPDPAFKNLKTADFKNEHAEILVFDFWRILANELSDQKNINYIGFGRSTDDKANTKVLKTLWGGTEKETFQTNGK